MAVPTTITDLSTTIASNGPNGATETPSVLDDYQRAHAGILRRLQAQGVAVASAATVNLGAIADGNYVHITGTTTITAFGTIAAGISRTLVFDGALTLTHNATTLILPGGANITTSAGDVAEFVSEGSGNWRCTSFTYKDSYGTWTPAFSPASGAFGSIAYLTQSGKYHKQGRLVTITCDIGTTALVAGTESGVVSITGLPFAIGGAAYGHAGYVYAWLTGETVRGIVAASGSSLQLLKSDINGNLQTSVTVSDMTYRASGGTDNIIRFVMSYFV